MSAFDQLKSAAQKTGKSIETRVDTEVKANRPLVISVALLALVVGTVIGHLFWH